MLAKLLSLVTPIKTSDIVLQSTMDECTQQTRYEFFYEEFYNWRVHRKFLTDQPLDHFEYGSLDIVTLGGLAFYKGDCIKLSPWNYALANNYKFTYVSFHAIFLACAEQRAKCWRKKWTWI